MIVSVVVKPGSKQPGISTENETLVVRVRARAIDGAANDECARAIAAHFQVPPSRVELVRGARGRAKLFRIR